MDLLLENISDIRKYSGAWIGDKIFNEFIFNSN